MTDRPRSGASRGIPVAEMTVFALVAVMMLLAKFMTRMPIKLPGHSGLLWMAALVIGRGVVKRPTAATLMGVVGGVLVAMFEPTRSGPFLVAAKYIVPGIVLDLLYPLLGSLDRLVPAVFAGAIAHTSKVGVDVVEQIVLHLGDRTASFWALYTLAHDTVGHIVFGALGGMLGAFVLKALIRAKIPQLRDRAAKEPETS